MRTSLIILLLICTSAISSQSASKAIKFVPQMSLKIGSQNPTLGGQFDLVTGILFNDRYLVGIGGGYCTNMGMGGGTFPIYTNARYFFSTKSFIFNKIDTENNFLTGIQIGVDVNNNQPFKTGFLAEIEFAYRLDFIKIKEFKMPPFYAGISIEYNYAKFIDNYRNYVILDGYLKQIMFNLRVSFDIPSIKILAQTK